MEEDAPQSEWNPNSQNDLQQDDGQDYPALPAVTWSASEFVSHQKSSTWYLLLAAGGFVATALVFLVTRSPFSSLVIAFACVMVGVIAARQPETKQYQIDEAGIHVGDKFFTYETFKSFSILEEGAIDCIWLRPLKKYMPTVAMYYGRDDEDKIIMMLENFLPLEDREHDVIDRISRRIRF